MTAPPGSARHSSEPGAVAYQAVRDTDLTTKGADRAPKRIGLDLDDFVLCLLQDAVNHATRDFWLRRAREFEDARPRLNEFYGERSVEELRAKWHELTELATACRNKAAVVRSGDAAISDEVRDAWRGVA